MRLHRTADAAGDRLLGAVAPAGSPRILLYSHDSWGLGHLRRNLTLAGELTRAFPAAGVVVVTGSPCATFFECPPRVELVKLPSVTKDERGAYVSRSLPGSLGSLLELRRQLLLALFRGFAPELLIVDHQVCGLRGEVLPLLREARRLGAACVLGVRDVIDAPEVVAREWGTEQARWALCEGYERVCVYGAPEVYDPRREYPIPPELGSRLEFTGYVVAEARPRSRRPIPATRPQVLVTMGGGEDGERRIQSYLDALALGAVPWTSVVVGGPLLGRSQARRLKREARLAGDVEFHRFHADMPRLLEESRVVVCMAGYNTCAEVMLHERPAVYLPRTFPRREQEIRATRLARLDHARCLIDPEPRALREAVETSLRSPALCGGAPPLGGARRMCEIAGALLSLELSGPKDAPARSFAS